MSRLFIVNLLVALVIAGSYWGRRIEGAEVAQSDFLSGLDLDFRGWKTQDMQLTAREMELLEPDGVVVRRFLAPDRSGMFAELAVIAGHRKKTVHTPGFCMAAGGWEQVAQRPFTISLADRQIPAVRTIFSQKSSRLMATYFFTDGSYSTRHLLRFQMVQMLRRLNVGVPLGALVRIIVPTSEDSTAAERLSDQFTAEVLPPVLQALREVRVQAR